MSFPNIKLSSLPPKLKLASLPQMIKLPTFPSMIQLPSLPRTLVVTSTDPQLVTSTGSGAEITRHISHSASSDDSNSSVHFEDKLVYTLSSIRYIREYAPTAPKVTDDQIKTHLSLLDGIPLLLVTESKADVAAVSFLRTNTSIQFYYAKNRPCTRKETDYIESSLKLITNYDLYKNEY